MEEIVINEEPQKVTCSGAVVIKFAPVFDKEDDNGE